MNDIQKLDVLLLKYKVFIEVLQKNRNDYEIVLQRYNYYKRQFLQPMRNKHYVNCETPSSDVCSCYYGDRFIKNLCLEIVDTIGFDYILNF